jgi:hypothetical protein
VIVAIHQPNYLPWFGYFAKLAQSDVLVLLDDVQYSKNSYINRVQVLNGDRRHWITIPVHVRLGVAIDAVSPAKPNWGRSHCDTLLTLYRRAPAFRSVWPDIVALFDSAPRDSIAAINAHFIKGFAELLGLSRRIVQSSAVETSEATGDARLAEIVAVLAPGATYLSGSGGRKYQDPATFDARGITLRYSRFAHPQYDQGACGFEAGLSVVDAAFRIGWAATRELIVASVE